MQKCYNCGKEVDDNTLICPDCGALVKRYTTPAPKAEPEQEVLRPAEPETMQAPGKKPAVFREDGKLRFSGGAKFWLILCLITTGWSVLSYGSFLSIYRNAPLYEEVFADVPDMLATLRAAMQLVEEFHWAFQVLQLIAVAKLCCYIWFMVSKKRLALYAVGLLSIAMLVVGLFSASGLTTVFCLLDAAVTWLIFLPVWTQLP